MIIWRERYLTIKTAGKVGAAILFGPNIKYVPVLFEFGHNIAERPFGYAALPGFLPDLQGIVVFIGILMKWPLDKIEGFAPVVTMKLASEIPTGIGPIVLDFFNYPKAMNRSGSLFGFCNRVRLR